MAMTKLEAIKRLETCDECGDCLTCAEHDEALEMALDALREQDATDIYVGHKTNADHIRSMTDKELGDFLDGIYCHGWSYGAADRMDDDPDYHEWLKQPYKEDT